MCARLSVLFLLSIKHTNTCPNYQRPIAISCLLLMEVPDGLFRVGHSLLSIVFSLQDRQFLWVNCYCWRIQTQRPTLYSKDKQFSECTQMCTSTHTYTHAHTDTHTHTHTCAHTHTHAHMQTRTHLHTHTHTHRHMQTQTHKHTVKKQTWKCTASYLDTNTSRGHRTNANDVPLALRIHFKRSPATESTVVLCGRYGPDRETPWTQPQKHPASSRPEPNRGGREQCNQESGKVIQSQESILRQDILQSPNQDNSNY